MFPNLLLKAWCVSLCLARICSLAKGRGHLDFQEHCWASTHTVPLSLHHSECTQLVHTFLALFRV